MKKRILAIGLVSVLALQIAAAPQAAGSPVSAASASTITEETSTMVAPGLKQNQFVYTDGGNRNACFTLEFDPKDPQITLAAGTPGDGDFYRLSTVRDMAEAALVNGKHVVAAMNSDMYNTSTGEPWGVVVKDGREIHGYNVAGRTWRFFGLKKDGTPVYGDQTVYNANRDDIQQAMGVHSVLVENGAVVNSDQSVIYAPRVAVGVKADGTVFFLLADGRQGAYSKGLTLQQTAQLMRARGAVWAGNLDGGGSATLLSRLPGENNFTVRNKPSDGKERRVANSWLFISNVESDADYQAVLQEIKNPSIAA